MGSEIRLKHGPQLVITDDITLDYQDFTDNCRFLITASSKTLTFPTPVKGLFDQPMYITNRGGGNNTLAGDFIGSTTTITLADAATVKVFVQETSTYGVYEWAVIGLGTSAAAELTADELAAVQGAATPTALNVFATMADVTGGLTSDEIDAVQGAAAPDAANVFATMADIPADELTADELASINGANTPTALNPVATMSDIPAASAGFDYVKGDTLGGTADDLDSILYATLVGGETALVINATEVKTYVYDETSAAAESDPTVIKPDDAGAGTGRWLEIPLDLNMIVDLVNANIAAGAAIVESKLALNYATHATTNDPTTDEKAALVNYRCDTLTGGASALDDVVTAGAATVGGELAHVLAGAAPATESSYYQFDKTAVDAESSPDIIRANDFGTDGQGCWFLVLVEGASLPYGTTADTICVGNDARIPTADQKAAIPDYQVDALATGAAGSLDAIVTAGTATVGGELARALVGAAPNTTEAWYLFDKAGVAAESSPDVIRPDDFATDAAGNWNLVLIAGASLPYGTTADTICVGNDARLPTTTEKAALPWAEANALATGAAGSLDALVTAGTATVGDEEVIVTLGAAPNQTFSRYRFEKTGVAAESSPDVIRPDDFATDGQGNWNLVLVEGASQTYGAEPAAVSSSTSGTAGTAETASRSDHGHDLADHTHAATFGAQLTMPVALSDYTAPAAWTPTIVWATATPEGMTITAKYMKVGKLVQWWLHIESADPGAGGGNITSIAFDANTQPVDVGAGNIRWPVTGFHQKDAGAGDTWTDMQAWLNCTAAADGDRLVTVKNGVVWADNEVTHLYLSGSHYMA